MKKYLITGLVLLAGCFLFGISALALWKAADTAHNVLTLGSYQVKIEEQYTQPGAVYPGMSVDKRVHIKNDGSVDALVRVRLKKVFGTRTENGVMEEDSLLDPELLLLSCNQNYWKEVDGYWYYTEVLKAGERTKEPLLESFRVSEKAGNAYKGKDAEIIVCMDSIQAEADALTLWNTSKEELKIPYELHAANQNTGVVFHGESEGFTFQGTEKDLFANFKYLVPGSSRTQRIKISNESETTVQMFLYAEVTEQDKLQPEEQKLLEQLLQEEAQIVIRSEKKTLYEGPVNGNVSGNSDSMGSRHRIPLGEFHAGQSKELIVELALNPELDTTYESLTGRVNWVFCAEGEEPVTAYVPKTGDRTPWMQTISMGVLSLGLFVLLLLRARSFRS